jgi:hypothetical protein
MGGGVETPVRGSWATAEAEQTSAVRAAVVIFIAVDLARLHMSVERELPEASKIRWSGILDVTPWHVELLKFATSE